MSTKNASVVLYVGNHNYSSWSLRPWLCLRWAGIAFEEVLISLAQPGYGTGEIKQVRAISPSGRVPALAVGDTAIWDSLAIAEWAADRNPRLWPEDLNQRAIARSATAEMHSGFPAIRNQLPMNIDRRCEASVLSADTEREIGRVLRLWRDLRSRFAAQGPWLMGKRSVADAFYTPIAARFRTYSIAMESDHQEYCDQLLGDADFQEWESRPITDRFGFIDDVFG